VLKSIASARDSAADTPSFLHRDREALSSSLDSQSDRAAELRGARRADDHERGVGFAREAGESYGDSA
jgi:hypothetical protein